MARSGQIQALLGDDFALDYIGATGDCFYEAVARALSYSPSPSSFSSSDGTTTTNSTSTDDDHPLTSATALRTIVANSLSQESYDLFQTAYDAGVAGFEFMRRINDLPTLRERHLVSGRDVGAGQCVWANDYALRTIATEFNLCLHIMDEESGRASRASSDGRTKRRRTAAAAATAAAAYEESSGNRRSGTFVTIRPESPSSTRDGDAGTSTSRHNARHICLQRTRRQHFNLIVQRLDDGEGDQSLRGIFDVLPSRMQELWGSEV